MNIELQNAIKLHTSGDLLLAKKKYEEISISSSYEGYKTSCNYLNGFIYILGNFATMLIYFMCKFKLIKSKLFI